jgi:DNA-binding response OmpR family regulator
VVEHDSEVRAMARQTLSDAGYGVLEASEGRTARLISKNFRNAIHLLVAGVVLTDMSGQELAAELALLYPGLRIIFFYSGTEPGDAAPRGSLMIDRHCQPKTLLEKVDETLAADLASEV